MFPTDADVPKDALNGRIDETFVPRAKVTLPEKGKFAEWKEAYLRELRTRVFCGYPDKPQSSPAPDIKNAFLMRVAEKPVFSWTKKSPPNYFERSHALLGHTMDEVWLRDTVASIRQDAAEKRPGYLHGAGQAGVIAAYATLLEPSVDELKIENPPKSHNDGPHFLGILRVLDIPEALGLLAPTPLTIIGGNDPAFDRTAEIYRLAGAADKLTRK